MTIMEDRMNIKDIMNRDVKLVSAQTTLKEAAETMDSTNVGFLPIGDNDELKGTLTDRDIVVNAIAKGKDPQQTKVSEILSPSVLCCREDQDVEEVARSMNEQQVRRMPIVDADKHLVGVVSIGDLAQHLSADMAGQVLKGVTA